MCHLSTYVYFFLAEFNVSFCLYQNDDIAEPNDRRAGEMAAVNSVSVLFDKKCF